MFSYGELIFELLKHMISNDNRSVTFSSMPPYFTRYHPNTKGL